MGIPWNNRSVIVYNKSQYINTWILPDTSYIPYNIHKVAPDEVGRLDLISYRVYGREDYFWILAHFNDILDVFNGFNNGDILQIPDASIYLERWSAVSNNPTF